ncbi:hypothetical protein J2W18_004684 [Rhodococcus cercidiphylli]|nr:hypothetical protein [Rhodococcus cercidiphylli]
MAQYGFRIFEVERMNGSGRTPKPFLDGEFGDFTAHLLHSYERVVGGKHHENPRDAFDLAGNPAPLDPNSRIVRLDWVHRGPTSVLFGFSMGKNDGFADAMSAQAGDPDVSIEHLAPRRQYRGVYVLPPHETTGVLALESISRSCPITPLRRWSNRWSKELAEVDSTAKYSRLSYSQMTDDSQVAQMLRDGEPQELVLSEHDSFSNGLPSKAQYRLVAPITDKAGAMAVARKWGRRNQTTTMSDGINEAKALVGPKIDSVEFDDCYLNVQHDGQIKQVRPDAFSELFTYDISTKQRETAEFFTKIQAKLSSLGLVRTMQLDLATWPTGLPSLHPAR